MQEMPKHRFDLLSMAMSFMAEKNKRNLYLKYAQRVHNQIAIIEQIERRPMQMGDWLQMAMTLGKQALQQDIGARQIAESIYPILDGSGQHLAKYANIPAESATKLLLWYTGLSKKIEPDLTALLIQVVAELQKISMNGRNMNPQPA